MQEETYLALDYHGRPLSHAWANDVATLQKPETTIEEKRKKHRQLHTTYVYVYMDGACARASVNRIRNHIFFLLSFHYSNVFVYILHILRARKFNSDFSRLQF